MTSLALLGENQLFALWGKAIINARSIQQNTKNQLELIAKQLRLPIMKLHSIETVIELLGKKFQKANIIRIKLSTIVNPVR